jgi:threonine/homoserine/homoserine lactone efflux protein
MVGVRTGKIAVSFAVFNILMLVSRTAVTFQVPVLTKFVEHSSGTSDLLSIFNLIIIISGVATVFGAFLIISGVILAFLKGEPRNVATLIISGCGLLGVGYLAEKINPGGGE